MYGKVRGKELTVKLEKLLVSRLRRQLLGVLDSLFESGALNSLSSHFECRWSV
jgi:hypothetical protein